MNTPRTIALVVALTFAAFALFAAACTTVLGIDFDAPHLATVDPLSADGGSDADDSGLCVPKSCAEQGKSCGTQNDGCGTAIECGSCKASERCVFGKCTCTPKTCPELGATCGVVDNGCGGATNCGTCTTAGEACSQTKCQCQPKTCAQRDANCGSIPDGCGNMYACGTCMGSPAGPNCGGAGPNKCGANPCVPITCAGRCGDVSDGCGVILHCAGCAAPQSCGGGGMQNVCGCTPTTCAQQGKSCNVISNGCGGSLDCGACSGVNTCGGGGTPNVCGCTPTATACPAGQNCGTVPNGCGINIGCGPACVSPNTCGGTGLTNVCGCEPKTCDYWICGTHPTGCGGSVSCGTCACFPAGTQISMADGTTKAIEGVAAGDWVLTTDPESGVTGRERVANSKVHAGELSRAGIVVVDGTLRATRNHPLRVNGKTVTMEDVRAGDTVMISDGAGGTTTKRVATVTIEGGGVVTYDLTLANPQAHYFANGHVTPQKVIP